MSCMTNIFAWISTSISDKQPSEFGGFEKHGHLKEVCTFQTIISVIKYSNK